MSAKAQLRLFKLYEGKTIGEALYAYEVMSHYIAQRTLDLRIKLCTKK